ncbi:MAG: alcohol dehydrogenase catalytic domain-containing protein, partial [Candidatus Bathyarchaeia archaeon]
MEGNMKAAILYGPRDIRVEEIPIPKINADQVLIKVEKCGICPSDVRRYVGVKKMFKPRMVPGHEFSGTVIEVGDAIKDINIGERVVSDWAIRCGKCYFCRINLPNYCLNLRRFQEESNGAFAQYTISFPSSIYKIPDSVSFEEAALTEPL